MAKEFLGEKTLTKLISMIADQFKKYPSPDQVADKQYVDDEIATFDFIKIVTELPETGVENRTYFVAKSSVEGNDMYDEYMWIDDAWEYIGTKQLEIDLTDYVKNTDYATDSKAGVVKGNKTRAFLIDPNGSVSADVWKASEYTNVGSAFLSVGTYENNKSRYVKEGITTNTIPLTDEEKATACNWLGACKQPTSTAYGNYLMTYNVSTNGEQGTNGLLKYAQSAQGWSIPYRNGNGCIDTGTPTEEAHATTKKYVDDALANLPSGGEKVYELVNTITVTPDTDGTLPSSVIFSLDGNGEAFNLSDFYVTAFLGISASSNLRLYINGAGVWGNQKPGSIGTSLRKWELAYNNLGNVGLVYAAASTLAQNAGYPHTNLGDSLLVPVLPNSSGNFSDITKIELGVMASDVTFIEGSTFKLWGVRK